MATVTIESIKLLAISGEFDAVKDEAITKAIVDAEATIESSSWCPEHVCAATENLAAHLLSVRLRGGQGVSGPITSASADGLSVSYGGATSTTTQGSYYQSTIYGQEYLRLFALQPLTPIAGCTAGAILYCC